MFNWSNLYANLVDKIEEQAYSKRKAEDLITYSMKPLTEHLIKILKWEDSKNNPKHLRDMKHQWMKEIQSTVLASSIKLKKSTLDRIVKEEPLDYFLVLMDSLEDKYSRELKSYRTDEEVKALLSNILGELSDRLFKLTKNSKPISMKDILDELGIRIYGI